MTETEAGQKPGEGCDLKSSALQGLSGSAKAKKMTRSDQVRVRDCCSEAPSGVPTDKSHQPPGPPTLDQGNYFEKKHCTWSESQEICST